MSSGVCRVTRSSWGTEWREGSSLGHACSSELCRDEAWRGPQDSAPSTSLRVPTSQRPWVLPALDSPGDDVVSLLAAFPGCGVRVLMWGQLGPGSAMVPAPIRGTSGHFS